MVSFTRLITLSARLTSKDANRAVGTMYPQWDEKHLLIKANMTSLSHLCLITNYPATCCHLLDKHSIAPVW